MRRARLLLVATVLGVAVPAGLGAANSVCAAESDVRVAVVVDFGPLADARQTPTTACVAVPEGGSGADALAARATILGTPPPRYDDSGLLCAIDGFPATGCGEATDGGYRYWAYFQGTDAGWTYASEGPATREAGAGTAEGWHFVDGSGMPTDPPPDADADPKAICETARAAPAAHRSERARYERGNGAPVGLLVGAGLAIAIAGAGWWVARRREQAASP